MKHAAYYDACATATAGGLFVGIVTRIADCARPEQRVSDYLFSRRQARQWARRAAKAWQNEESI